MHLLQGKEAEDDRGEAAGSEAKRLLNRSRILRSTQYLSDASRFLGADGAEGEFQAVAMLLGLLTANPRLLGQILFAAPEPEQELLGGICQRTMQFSWGGGPGRASTASQR